MAAAHAAATPSADEAPSTRLAIVGVAGADVGRAEAAPATVPAVVGGEEESKEGHEDLDDAAASAAVGSESTAFAFTLQSEWRLSCEKHKETKLLLTKWGLEESLVVRKFAFSRRLDLAAAASTGNRSEMIKSLLRDLLADPVVRSAVPIGGTLRSGCMLPSTGITDVEFKELKTTQTSMEFFDRLEEDDIVVAPMWPTPEEDAAAEADDAGAGRVGAGGYVRKQFDVVVDGVTCQDHLRDVLVNPDTEHVGLFDEDDDQQELLFRVFKQFVVGGSMCQWEDNVRPYLEATQSAYRDIVRVTKGAHTDALTVQVVALSLGSARGDTGRLSLFPKTNDHNSCMVILDAQQRTAIVWYCPFVPFW